MAPKRDGSKEEALELAFKFLSYRARSEAELRAKLTQRGFPKKITETTLDKLRSLNLVNDEAFARDWASGRIRSRGYGPLRVDMELRQKGISRALIGKVLKETFGEEENKERAKRLLEKRFRGKDFTDAKTFRRAVAFLQRRGYRDSVIAEVLRRSWDE